MNSDVPPSSTDISSPSVKKALSLPQCLLVFFLAALFPPCCSTYVLSPPPPPPPLQQQTRRDFAAATFAGIATGLVAPARPSWAAKTWISGKSDPNDKPKKDAGDRTGTKKDIKFLRCLSNCVSDCTTPTGGRGKDRDECSTECQDDCCQTYEQCTCVLNPNLT